MVDFTSTAIERINNTPSFSEAVEKAIIEGDYNKLTPDERIKYYHAVCHSVGLNPLTRPFDAMKSQDGSYKLYARKEAAEQLRKIYNVSIKTTLRERIGDLYFVSVEASMPGGRTETSEAVVSLTKSKEKAEWQLA